MQQFISDSPWSGYDLISALQQDITMHPQFQEESLPRLGRPQGYAPT